MSTSPPVALVVTESMFGNTASIGRRVAEALLDDGVPTEVVDVGAAAVDLPPTVRLLVVGAPTHAFSLSRPSTRADAVRQGASEDRARTGVREWLGSVLPQDQRHAPRVAIFDTRVSKVRRLPAAAGPRAARLARRRGLQVATRPEAFLVQDVRGPLLEGEEARARSWGHYLATLVSGREVTRQG